MSLRDNLHRTATPELRVARAKERNSATSEETPQLGPQLLRNLSSAITGRRGAIETATGSATPPQLNSCAAAPGATVGATELRSCVSLGNATRNSALTAHRITTQLVDAVSRACEIRGDGEVNRRGGGLIAECSALPLDGQADMRDHFNGVARLWRAAIGLEKG